MEKKARLVWGTRRQYTEAQKAEALNELRANPDKDNPETLKQIALRLNIDVVTLKFWKNKAGLVERISREYTKAQKEEALNALRANQEKGNPETVEQIAQRLNIEVSALRTWKHRLVLVQSRKKKAGSIQQDRGQYMEVQNDNALNVLLDSLTNHFETIKTTAC